MAITIPTSFPLHPAAYAGEIATSRDIDAPDVGVLREAVTNRFARGGLRPLLEFDRHAGATTSVASGTSREVLCKGTGAFQERRDDVYWVIDAADVDFEIAVRNAADTLTLASTTGSTPAARGTQSGTLSVGSLGQDVIVRVSVRKTASAAGDGTIYAVRVLESACTVANLPG